MESESEQDDGWSLKKQLKRTLTESKIVVFL